MSGCSNCSGCSGCGQKSTIIVAYGDQQAQGCLAGLTIAQVRQKIANDLPDLAVPADAVPCVATATPNDPAWQQIAAEETTCLLTSATPRGAVLIQAVSKDVPESYVLRDGDIYLEFRDPTA